MSYIYWAYGSGIVQLILSLVPEEGGLSIISSLGIITMILLSKDAQERSLPQGHCAWAFLGVIGVAIYHLAFAKNAPVRRKVPFFTFPFGKNK